MRKPRFLTKWSLRSAGCAHKKERMGSQPHERAVAQSAAQLDKTNDNYYGNFIFEERTQEMHKIFGIITAVVYVLCILIVWARDIAKVAAAYLFSHSRPHRLIASHNPDSQCCDLCFRVTIHTGNRFGTAVARPRRKTLLPAPVCRVRSPRCRLPMRVCRLRRRHK